MQSGKFDPVGDYLTSRELDDNIIRLAYQNIWDSSLTSGLAQPEEVGAIFDLGIDVMGMSKMNRPWTAIYTSTPSTEHTASYQPGGNLLTVNGSTTGRIATCGSDSMGHYCWYTL